MNPRPNLPWLPPPALDPDAPPVPLTVANYRDLVFSGTSPHIHIDWPPRHPWSRLSGCAQMLASLVAGDLLLQAGRGRQRDVMRTALEVGHAWLAGEATYDELLAPCREITAPWNVSDVDADGLAELACSVFNVIAMPRSYATVAYAFGAMRASGGDIDAFATRWWATTCAALPVREIRNVVFDGLHVHRHLGKRPLADAIRAGRRQRRLALGVAAMLADRSLIEPLWSVIAEAGRERVDPATAVEALARIGDGAIVPRVVDWLRAGSRPDDLRVRMIVLLDMLEPDTRGVEAIADLLRSGDSGLADEIARTLLAWNCSPAARHVIAAHGPPTWRKAAAQLDTPSDHR